MEPFYRYMRKKHNVLMIGDNPEGGKWNYDKSNRLKWKKEFHIPKYLEFKNEVTEIIKAINDTQIKTIGVFSGSTFNYPINRKQALEQLKYFCEHLLIYIGDYQDAMHTEEVFLFHSRLSFAMNLKILSPKDIINTVINYWNKNEREIHISQIEGFIRQILGWREYMRGMYWGGVNARIQNAKLPRKQQ